MPSSAWIRLLVSVISPRKVDLIRLSRPTFSWILNSPANSEMRRVVWGSWFSERRGLRQCLLTLNLDRSNWQGRVQPLPQVSSQGQLTLGTGSMSGSNTLKQISFQSLSPQMIWCAVSSNIIERESTPLPASTLRQLRKQKWVKLASRVLNFSYSARKVVSLLNSAISMQRAHIVPTENSSAFLRHSLTASASTSPKERYFSDPSRYFSSDSLYSTFPRSYPERSLRKACSVLRKPMESYEYTCFRISSRQSRRPAKVSRFYLERSTEEERLANSMPHGEHLPAGSRREVALVIRGELFGLVGVDVLFPIAYFCIINQLHSWGSIITEPLQGEAVGTFTRQRGKWEEGGSYFEGVEVKLAGFSFYWMVQGYLR